jgi:hypothetical protein
LGSAVSGIVAEQNRIWASLREAVAPSLQLWGFISLIRAVTREGGEMRGGRKVVRDNMSSIHPPATHLSFHPYITTRSIYQSTHPLPYCRQSIPLLSSSVIHESSRLSMKSSLHEPTPHQSMNPLACPSVHLFMSQLHTNP